MSTQGNESPIDRRHSEFVMAINRRQLGSTQPPIQWVFWALTMGVKRPGREANCSPPSSAEIQNAWSYTSTPPMSPWHGT